ncbi:MAG TPA: ATP-binding cassette domain-containing protein [Promineifilum sp.]|nr:ATP-binding cassette domain-containing protein [Promineifilum sp.]
MTADGIIAIRRLTYHYPQRPTPALRDVTWDVADGEFVLVAGASGSGKSTLLRCLNGLVPHFSGGVLAGQMAVAGIDVIAAGPRVMSRHVGFVAQDPEAQAVLDRVEGEIAFALENAAVPPAEMHRRVEQALDLVELTPLRDRPLDTLSGGERQRLAIAAALALQPRVLVLDEPTSQLDPQSAEEVLRALVRLKAGLGLTIILAEHRLERIARYADRLTFLEDGRVVLDGPVRTTLPLIPGAPPVVALGRALGWQPAPLTVKEARPLAATLPVAAFPVPQATPVPEKPIAPRLQVEGLRFSYNGQETLRGIDLSVAPGEVVALVGRNGAGKSTLLKCIVGLLRGQAGEVRVNGRSTLGRHVADICREIGYLPQNADDLLFADTVADEMRVTLRNHGLAATAVEQAAWLARLGLTELARAYPRDLSAGQRQRVALGAVTATQPRLLLLDEPTRGLDWAAKTALVALWRGWLAEGAAMLLVTHDVELAATFAQQTVILSRGEVIAAGPTRDVLAGAPHFAPQMARLFPGRGWLTVEDALRGLGRPASGANEWEDKQCRD